MSKSKDGGTQKVEHPKIREAERYEKLKKNKPQLYCFKCGKEIPKNHLFKKDEYGRLIGQCLHKTKGGCQRKTHFVTKKELEEDKLPQAKEIITKEFDEINRILKDPSLLVNTIQEIQNNGVSGEEDTILSLIILANTRLVTDAKPESKNLFLSDKTGIGKDYTTKKTLEVILPKENHLHATKMSNEAFTYWHAGENNWDWNDKVIHLEDITQSLLNCPTFKTMASGGSSAVVVKDQKTKEININGKPCIIITSHHANPEDEALRRFPIGSLNDSIEQTRRVKDKISKKYTKREITIENILLRKAIQNLKPNTVIIPYAELIQYFFPEDILMRTHYPRFLDYICSSAIFHQHQREKTEKNEIIATPDDYMIGRIVLIYTTSNPKMIPMSKEYRDLLQILQENVTPMSVNEIFIKFDKSKKWLYRHLPSLVSTGLVIKGTRESKEANREIDTYQFTEMNPNAVPTWDEIYKKLKKIDEKTENTENTNEDKLEENELRKWFFHNAKIEKKPNTDSSILHFSNWKIPLNGKVFSVFPKISNYLRDRDEKRYRRYYEERDLQLHEKIQDLKRKIIENRKAGYRINDDFLLNNFDQNFIFKCKESGLLMKQGNGEYIFGG